MEVAEAPTGSDKDPNGAREVSDKGPRGVGEGCKRGPGGVRQESERSPRRVREGSEKSSETALKRLMSETGSRIKKVGVPRGGCANFWPELSKTHHVLSILETVRVRRLTQWFRSILQKKTKKNTVFVQEVQNHRACAENVASDPHTLPPNSNFDIEIFVFTAPVQSNRKFDATRDAQTWPGERNARAPPSLLLAA